MEIKTQGEISTMTTRANHLDKWVRVDDVVERLKYLQKHKYFNNTELNELLNEFKEFKED